MMPLPLSSALSGMLPWIMQRVKFGPVALVPLLAKCDIQSAFHLLPIHAGDFCLLGFKLSGSHFINKDKLMDCSVTCSFLDWVVKDSTGCPHKSHYLDNFYLWAPCSHLVPTAGLCLLPHPCRICRASVWASIWFQFKTLSSALFPIVQYIWQSSEAKDVLQPLLCPW